MSYINLKHLWMSYDDQVVLENINAKVEQGEFITIVGASGCGKTTLLNLLLGTETASRGELLLAGQPIAAEPDARRGIVFQRYSVFPHLTVLGNVLIAGEFGASPFLARLVGQARKQARDEAMSLIERVGLKDASDKYPHQLSGGMQQRLALAQSLIAKPKVLLLDEPFGALDPGIRKDMHELVLDLWREHGLTVFMITHDLSEGFKLGTRLWVFDKVRIDPDEPQAYGARITYDLPAGDRPRLDNDAPKSIREPQ
ncbi:MAG: ATP-binding cassette domain-containing protein [Burkholderiaceae bacterium]